MLRKLTVNEKWPNNNLFIDKQYYINESQIPNKELYKFTMSNTNIKNDRKKEKTAKTKGKMYLFIQKHCIKVEHICISPSWDGKKLDISLFGIFISVIVSPHNRVNVYRVLSPALLYVL